MLWVGTYIVVPFVNCQFRKDDNLVSVLVFSLMRRNTRSAVFYLSFAFLDCTFYNFCLTDPGHTQSNVVEHSKQMLGWGLFWCLGKPYCKKSTSFVIKDNVIPRLDCNFVSTSCTLWTTLCSCFYQKMSWFSDICRLCFFWM